MDDPNEASQISSDFNQPEFDPFPITRFTDFGDFRFYYAYGNTTTEDFLENVTTGVREPVVLSLGCGDIRSCLYTLWKYFNPEHGDQRFDGVHFVLNDFSAAVLARNILFLYLCMQMPTGRKKIKRWIAAFWAIWYSHELKPSHVHTLKGALSDLLKFSVDLRSWSESAENPLRGIVKFTSTATLREIHDIWKMWYEDDVKVGSVSDMHVARRKEISTKCRGYTTEYLVQNGMGSIVDALIQSYIPAKRVHTMEKEVGNYITTGCCFAETVLNLPSFSESDRSSVNVTFYERRDGKYTLHYNSLPYKCFFHTVEFSPAALSEDSGAVSLSDSIVGGASFKANPLLTNSIQQFATWLMSSAKSLKQCTSSGMPRISFNFDSSDAIAFCQQFQQDPKAQAFRSSLGFEAKFDLIYSSNLFDHVAPPNLILSTNPLLKEDGLHFATSLLYKSMEPTGEQYLQTCFGFGSKLLPLLCATRCMGMEGEYSDSIAVSPEPAGVQNMTVVSLWPKLFVFQHVHMSPLCIRDIGHNSEVLAALESSVFKMLTALFQDGAAHTTRQFSPETAIAVLLSFVSKVQNDIDVTNFSFWLPLCSRLCKLTYLRPFLFQFQIQAFLHGLHLHLTVTEAVCPLCNNIPLSKYLWQFSVRVPQNHLPTPAYLICLYKSNPTDFNVLRGSSLLMKSEGGIKDAFLHLVSELDSESHLIDCVTGHQVEGKLQLDFFLPNSVAIEGYKFMVIAFYRGSTFTGEPDVNIPMKVLEGKLKDLHTSQVSYTFQQVLDMSREPETASSFGRVTDHSGDSNHFESVISLSGPVQSALTNTKLTTKQVSKVKLEILCGDHRIALCYPYPIAYSRVNIKLSRQKGTVTMIVPREAHCFYTERPLFMASPDLPASLPPLKLADEFYVSTCGMQYTNRDRQLKHQSKQSGSLQHLPAVLSLKESFNIIFQCSKPNSYFQVQFPGDDIDVGYLVVHNSVFDLHRRTPAVDLSFCFPRTEEESLQIFFQLSPCFSAKTRVTKIIVDKKELALMKEVFPYFALRTISFPTSSRGYMGLLKKYDLLQHFTRAVIYPLYADADLWVRDLNLTEAFGLSPDKSPQEPQKNRGKSNASKAGSDAKVVSSDGSASCPSSTPSKSVDGEVNKPEDCRSDAQPQTCGYCQEPSRSLKACAACGMVSYCSKDCQRKHWSEHKPLCTQHRGMETSKATTSTPQEPPIPTSQCSGCNKASQSLKKCRCHLAAYCSVECQRNDWTRHKDNCTARLSQK